MLRLGSIALQDAAEEVEESIPLFLALQEVRPGQPDSIHPAFLSQLSKLAQVTILERQSKLFRQGGAGFMFALLEGFKLLQSGKARSVLVGGIDTFLDLPRLATLDSENRIMSHGAADAFVGGEGAAFLRLEAPTGRRSEANTTFAQIISVGLGTEKGHRYSAEPYRGDGLAEAFGNTLDFLPKEFPKIRCVYCGFNGENLPAKEWGVAFMRNAERFESELQIEHPAECIGDAGAALGAVAAACAAIGLKRGYRQSPCLVWSTSDYEARGAAVLSSPT
jgi:3-oxoacyl-[acyl-carrier-protein] synthase-1